ncbi:hypothetical protein AWZ03_005054 [Drosophila navojoa]|uniref:Uncharacterized protein n=1 Tax=Drosophila navojoa TaxID=7232 RepID=A0A484BKE0_DRONA|nr:hypothetical protein AWZ03_005054 [Drosophila navojoa]
MKLGAESGDAALAERDLPMLTESSKMLRGRIAPLESSKTWQQQPQQQLELETLRRKLPALVEVLRNGSAARKSSTKPASGPSRVEAGIPLSQVPSRGSPDLISVRG